MLARAEGVVIAEPADALESVTENDSSASNVRSPTMLTVIVCVVSEAVKVRVPEVGPEKSAAAAVLVPPILVSDQSIVASPLGLVRVTAKVNGVVPTLPSALLADAVAIAKLCPAAVVKSRSPAARPVKLLPLVS